MTLLQPLYDRLNSDGRTIGRSRQGWIFVGLVSLVLFGGIAQRLVHLQLMEGAALRARAERNRVQTIPKTPSRGNILDRDGNLLAGNELTQSVSVWRTAVNRSTWPRLRQILSTTLGISEEELQSRADHVDFNSRFLIPVQHNVKPEEVVRLREYGVDLQGVQIERETSRSYPYGELAAHALGYIGEISKEELESKRFRSQKTAKGYRNGDIVGKMGLEKSLEFTLRGYPGSGRVEIDGKGNLVEILDDRPARSGDDLHLTLDIDIQKAAESALNGRNGAVVALNPKTGEVLALASEPRFDPNLFTRKIDKRTWDALQKRRHPFVNRALQAYPPASTFKVVTTIAAVESGKLPPSAVLPTYAYLPVDGTRVWDWNKSGFGPMSFISAMAMSSNTFFGQAGLKAGEENLAYWARKLGFGSPTGIELKFEESQGLIPDSDWKRSKKLGKWHRVDTVNASIGQGYVQASPLQVAVMFAAVANGGDRIQPRLVKSSPIVRESLGLKSSTLELLRKALHSVVTNGTGKALAGTVSAAGKSGTAEDPPRETHAWFGAYAPFEKPEVVVVAFLENGGGGGKVAGPVVRSVMDAYFAKARQPKKAKAGGKGAPASRANATNPASSATTATPDGARKANGSNNTNNPSPTQTPGAR
jgi:penicillin-binding protein 2